ncbi:hypothetical protein VNO77_23142 [Canavalia gladiata]|uniref:Uncharacterized protein n=1 Tax=Canavalia gladiata TaxID=3824 RepID=A0AAN9QF47_CANGL
MDQQEWPLYRASKTSPYSIYEISEKGTMHHSPSSAVQPCTVPVTLNALWNARHRANGSMFSWLPDKRSFITFWALANA